VSDRRSIREALSGFISGSGTQTDRVNNRRVTQFSMLWALAIVGAAWVVKFTTLPDVLKWGIALTPNLLAILVLRSYLKFLRMTDEMWRRIHTEGLAVGFGVSYLFVIGYLVAQGAGAPPLDLTYFVLVMTAGWLVGNIMAMKHYQ